MQIELEDKAPKVGDGLVVTIPSESKVKMLTRAHSAPRVTDTIARGKVVEVTRDMVTVKPMGSHTNVRKLQRLAQTKAKVGVSTIENRIRVHFNNL